MKKDKVMLILLLLVLLVLGSLMVYLSFKGEVEINLSDAIKIKEEYADLNDKVNENNQRIYPKVVLSDDNIFDISSEDEVIEILKSDGMVFLGDSNDAYSRTLISLVDKVSKDYDIDKIAYLDISKVKDVIDVDDLGEPIVKEEGSNGYYQILDILDEWLPTYYVKNKDGEEVDTKEKKVVVPMVIVANGGKVEKVKMGTISSQKNGYDILSSDEENKITDELKSLFSIVNKDSCSIDEAC